MTYWERTHPACPVSKAVQLENRSSSYGSAMRFTLGFMSSNRRYTGEAGPQPESQPEYSQSTPEYSTPISVDQAVDFVMSKINLWVGTRAESSQAPVQYEMPREVVTEAIVNAVVHRDYTSNGSVQVMLFADRLEVWNPGTLPTTLTLDKLREPHASVPWNPLLAEPMYLAQYIERMGTGTGDMIQRCRDAGLGEAEFSLTDGFLTTIRRKTGEVTREVISELALQPESNTSIGEVNGEVGPQPESQSESSRSTVEVESQPESLEQRVLRLLGNTSLSKSALSRSLGQKEISGHLNQLIAVMLADRTIKYTIPDKPTSSKQRYRLTEKGIALLSLLRKESKQ